VPAVSRERWPLILGLSAAPASIAISEFFLSIAALVHLVRLLRRQTRVRWPRSLGFWLALALLQVLLWILSPEPASGWSEIRHLLLLGVVLLVLSDFDRAYDVLMAWKGIFVSATLSSLYLIGEFFYRLHLYREEIAAGGDASFYLRSGGLLHHWMVYGTVEIIVVAGLIGFWSAYPGQRRRLWPIVVINTVAVVLSLTRMAWITCFLLLVLNLLWRRSKWILAVPLLPVVLYGLAPEAVRSRVTTAMDLRYYANAERLQMLTVGWRMVLDHPITGIGPGRVDKLYESYLKEGEPVPAYHGHLRNNAAQIGAQFGIPVMIVALVFVVVLIRDLLHARSSAKTPDQQFLSETAVLAFFGFLFAGLFEYTYGHSLGLIMIAFAVCPALLWGIGRKGAVLHKL
jgi:O-Antigen ligase